MLIGANLRAALPKARLRFATLTVRAVDTPLSEALDHLYTSFAKLRRSRLWRDHVQGGVAVLEVTWRAEKSRWHPHLHIIFEGNYLPQTALRTQWHAATGDSYIVDVRAIKGVDQATRYITTYLTKSLAKGVWHDDARLSEAIRALHGRKLIMAFGTWHKLKLLTPPDSDREWVPYISADRLFHYVLRGDIGARRLATSIFERHFLDWLKEHPP